MQWQRHAASAFIYLVAYIILSKAGQSLEYTELRSSPWNPETAIAVVAGLRSGWRAVPVIFVANISASLLFRSPFSFELVSALAAAHTVIFAAIPAFISSRWKAAPAISVRGAALGIVLAAGMTVLSAVTRLSIIQIAFNLPIAITFKYTFAQAVGNAIAVLTLASLYPAFRNGLGAWQRWSWLDTATLAGILVAVFVVFGLDSTDEFKFFYLLFLPVIAFALRRGFAGATFSIMVTDLAMIAILLQRSYEPSTVTELQLLMLTLSVTGLMLGASISEREHVASQFQESQSALMRSSRLSLVSEMASALSHELNQPLSAVRSYIRAVRRKMENSSQFDAGIAAEIDAAVKEIDSAAAIIKSMRQFLERDKGQFRMVQINAWLTQTVDLVREDFRKAHVSITLDVPAGLPKGYGNYVQLQQVLVNLLRNAREAGGANGKTSAVNISANSAARPGFIEIMVRDNGPGVSDEFREQLFKPLLSSKEDGLGLGLSLCSTIMRNHGGNIWLASSSAMGSVFAFTIPIAKGSTSGGA